MQLTAFVPPDIRGMSLLYSAPKRLFAIKNRHYGLPGDVNSYGVVLFELLSNFRKDGDIWKMANKYYLIKVNDSSLLFLHKIGD